MYRYRRKQKQLEKMTRADGCPFCELENPALNPHPRKVVEQTAHMQVVTNAFPYDVWEESSVQEQLMLIPQRHITSMADFTPSERQEYVDLLCAYEARGYSVYTRAPSNMIRTQPHIHTHFIKLGAKRARGYISIQKPYLLIRW